MSVGVLEELLPMLPGFSAGDGLASAAKPGIEK